MGMQLTEENYYSDIANYEYMSVSQFKDFNGTYGRVACEEAALAKTQRRVCAGKLNSIGGWQLC